MLLKKTSLSKKIKNVWDTPKRFGSFQSRGVRSVGREATHQVQKKFLPNELPLPRRQQFLAAKEDLDRKLSALFSDFTLKINEKFQKDRLHSGNPEFCTECSHTSHIIYRKVRQFKNAFPEVSFDFDIEDVVLSSSQVLKVESPKGGPSILDTSDKAARTATNVKGLFGGAALPKPTSGDVDSTGPFGDI